MSRFKITTAVFAVFLLLMLFAGFCTKVNIFFYAALVLLYIAVVSWAAATINAGFFMPVVCKAPTREKMAALTFDDGPAAYTGEILDILKSYNVKATFFCTGKNIEENPAMLQRIDAEGHIIGGHSYSHHFWFDLFSSEKMYRELEKTETIVAKLTGKRISLFRPPYGVTNPPLAKAVKRLNYSVVGWSVRSGDTYIKDKNRLLGRLKKKIHAGAIILLHDSEKVTSKVLPSLIEFLLQNNYDIRTLDGLLKINAYEV